MKQLRVSDKAFMHEYGHYIQSQEYGWGYLFSVGIPSLFSAANSEKDYGYVLNSKGGAIWLSSHSVYWAEMSANKKAAKYFKKYGVNWGDDYYFKYPTSYPSDLIKP